MSKRLDMPPTAYAELNQKILQQFKTINLAEVSCIHTYLPILSKREPDTLTLINWLKAYHPQIKRVFPKVNFLNHTMQSFIDDGSLELSNNAYGITEPLGGNEVNVTEIDMVIVPLLAFDEQGYRVGYGKGFYDRFLTGCRADTKFIGLSFFDPIDRIVDLNEYDLPLHECITPDKIWEF